GEAIDDGAVVALQPPRVLLADDDPMVRHLATSILESGGYRVRQARDGVEALSIIDAGEDVSLVVTDLRMPGLGGDGLVQQLRSRVQTAMLPIIVLTGSDEYDTEVKLMDAGADDYIRKPIDPPRFLARVKAALRRAGVS
ncbi:MAG: response regulator transcription factor, partial [Polaromonas sp.]|nr:response regulator transcription factor [Gemmatimonadaceae bacterium]